MYSLIWLCRHTEADALVAEAKAMYASTQAYSIALSYALSNDQDQSLSWLDRAYDNRNPGLTLMGVDPPLSNLRDVARFKVFLRRMNLPEYSHPVPVSSRP
jgi:hypothetical protein